MANAWESAPLAETSGNTTNKTPAWMSAPVADNPNAAKPFNPSTAKPVSEPKPTQNTGAIPPAESNWYNPIMVGANRVQQQGAMALNQAGILSPETTAEFISKQEADIAQYPYSKAIKEGQATSESMAENYPEDWAAQFWSLAENPSYLGSVIGESLPQSVTPMVTGAAGGAVGGLPGVVVGAGLGSFLSEYNATIMEEMRESGVNAADPSQMTAAIRNPELMARARDRGIKRGIPIAVFDGLSFGLAGKFYAPVKAVAGKLAGGAAEVGFQAATGAAGEAAGQVADKGAITSPGDVIKEGVAEIVTGAAEPFISGGFDDSNVKETDVLNPNEIDPSVLDVGNRNIERQALPAPVITVDPQGVAATQAQAEAAQAASNARVTDLGLSPDIIQAGAMHPAAPNETPAVEQPVDYAGELEVYAKNATKALPAPVIQVDTAGNAGTQAQRFEAGIDVPRETLGLTPDVAEAMKRHPGRANSQETIQAREAMESRLPPNYQDKRLARKVFKNSLVDMSKQLIKGGGITLTGGQFTPDSDGISVDKLSPVVRSKSQNPKWYQEMAISHPGITVEKLQSAVKKATEGKKLGVGEIRWVADMLDQVTGERTDPEVLQWKRGELEKARQYRQEAARGLPPLDAYEADTQNAGEIFNEDEYDPEWDGRGRTLFELLEDAKTVNEAKAFEIFESDVGNFVVAARLAELIHEGRSNEKQNEQAAPVDTGTVPEEQRTEEDTGQAPDTAAGRETELIQPQPVTPQTPANAGVSASGDLFGLNTATQQAIAERQRQIDEKLGKGREQVPAESAGDLFDPNREKQTDLLDAAAHAAATSPKNDLPEPTPAQVEAGNYKKGHVRVQGLDISIENPKGSIRRSKPGAKVAWEREMQDHYGYIKRTEGNDGDHIDVFVGNETDSDRAFIIDQTNENGAFDEHKIMLGYQSADEAKTAYLRNYQKGWKGLGQLTEMSVSEFKDWLKNSDTSKPFASPKSTSNEVTKPEPPAVAPETEAPGPIVTGEAEPSGGSGPEPEKPKPRPAAKNKPQTQLSKIKITEEYYVSDTGQTVEVTKAAEDMLNDINSRISGMKSLIACLGSS